MTELGGDTCHTLPVTLCTAPAAPSAQQQQAAQQQAAQQAQKDVGKTPVDIRCSDSGGLGAT
jgi:hypothetical protein